MMRAYYRVKRFLKIGRLQYRRWLASRNWGRAALHQAPKVFGIALPKGGSHFIHQTLSGLAEIGPFIKPGLPPVNRFEDNSQLSQEEILLNINRMKSGEIRYGYIPCVEPFLQSLTKPDRATVFIYRDPRDLVISHVFYATDMHLGHGMHEYYQQLHSMEDRINVAIEGCKIEGSELPSIWERYQPHLKWINTPEVLSVRFEDLILNREAVLANILEYIESFGVIFSIPRQEAIEKLGSAIKPKKSGTFRKGKPGNWQEHFTPDNKKRFQEVAGDLLSKLGYEENDLEW
ncbi:MAG: sulfotransferase domain-containing protein [Anaerolineales bacterium]